VLFKILTAVFIVHGIVFLVLGAHRRDRRFFVLSGTFAFLSVLYGLKAAAWNGTVAGSGLHWSLVLRAGAITCTLVYFYLSSRRPGTWIHRLAQRGRSDT